MDATWLVPPALAPGTGQPANMPPEGCFSLLTWWLIFFFFFLPFVWFSHVFKFGQMGKKKKKKMKSSVNPSNHAMCMGERKPESFSGCLTDCYKLSSNTCRESRAKISTEGLQPGNSGCASFFRERLWLSGPLANPTPMEDPWLIVVFKESLLISNRN